MNEAINTPSTIQVIIFGNSRDNIVNIEVALRNAGLAVHCDQVTNLASLEEKLTSKIFDLMLCYAFDANVNIQHTFEILAKHDLDLPILALFVDANPKELLQLMRMGVRDFVRETSVEHLQLVVMRELRDLQQRRELTELKRKFQASEQRSHNLVSTSREAMAFFHDGMHVQVNPAYLQLLGLKDKDAVEALPLLDVVDKNYHKTLRAAIKNLENSPEQNQSILEIVFKHQNGSNLPLSVIINNVELDGEHCIQMAVRGPAINIKESNVTPLPVTSKTVATTPITNTSSTTSIKPNVEEATPKTNQTAPPPVTKAVVERSNEDSRVLQILDRALSHNKFNLVYSSIVNLHGGGTRENYTVGIKLQDDRGQELKPEMFMEIARRYEKLNKIDRWIIRHSIAAISAQRQNGKRISTFIPISDVSIVDKNLLLWIVECLREFEARGGWLTFQIGEKYARDNIQVVAKLIEGLKTMKCQIALDQFGLLPNPEGLLNQIEVDYVKLAPNFVQNLHTDQAKQDALGQMNEMLMRHKVKTIASAVEDSNALSILWNLGITYIQGNFAQEPSVNIEVV
jgi:PAS domain S-box-containing protein